MQAATLGLVVGVSDYAAYEPFGTISEPGQAYDLQGAANDARLIAAAMRRAGIDLPDARLLLDEGATQAGFLAAWQGMLLQAAPGDTLVVTFAGHGAQETERAPPFDERDKRDETIMFHDFDPQRPGTGRLTDDALYALFAASPQFDIVWLSDSCHSGGLTRSAGRTLSRFAGLFDGLAAPELAEVPVGPDVNADPDQPLPHVTQILASASEELTVDEIEIDGAMHGALSWYFAKALSGEADADGDGRTTRAELSVFLDVRVFTHMNQTQQPRILPQGDNKILVETAALPLSGAALQPDPSSEKIDTRLPVSVIGAPPPGLDPDRVRQVALGAALSFEAQTPDRWMVKNRTGDLITFIDRAGGSEDLPVSAAPLVARAEALDRIRPMVAATAGAPRLSLQNGQGYLRMGQEAAFLYEGPEEDLPYLTLFNIAATGAVQVVYPPAHASGLISGGRFSFRSPVIPPPGVDQLVAAACPTPPRDLRAVLEALDGRTVTADLIEVMAAAPCQFTMLGLYTTQ